jgi:predicted nucleic acid-binding protein
MHGVTYDTNIMLRYRRSLLPSDFFMSAVVVQEMTAGAADEADVRLHKTAMRHYETKGRLLVPTGEDWWHAGKILNALYRGLKSRRKGRTPAIPKEEQQRILRDVLIARTAKRAGVAVVTENVADFEKIRRFCDVRVLAPAQYFPT